uniref:Uncharacterized protein n=1 Tax=Tanacetum cinerariifolium TaxID=118510 RepID=A0A6L2N4Y5_TANCI|nr:hypothetical protein [Tanacetum cinerariifolium]
MDTTIDQQVAMNEAFVPTPQRLKIGRSNFRLLSDIKFKESTLQLVYDVLRICPFFKAFLVTADVDILHICPRVHGQSFAEPPFEEEILTFIRFLRHIAAIRMLTDVNINKLYQPWRSFAAIINKCLTGPKPKVSVRRTRSGYDTSITPPTAAASPKLTASIKDKQTAKASKAKSLYALSEPSGSGADEGTGSKPGVPDVPTDEPKEELSWNSTDDEGDDNEEKNDDGDEEDEGDDDDDQEVEKDDDKDDTKERGDDEEEGRDESDGKKDQGLNISKEERYVKEEDEDELYRDVNINQGRGVQATLKVEDSHVTLTPVNPDGQQQSSSVSSQFVTSMLNPTIDVGMESIFETTSQLDVQTPTSVAPLPITTPTMTSATIATTITSQAPILPTTILIKKIEGNKSIQCSDEQRNLYKALVDAYESDKIILDTYGETATLKRRRDDDADKDEEPSARPDRGSKRRREGKEPESASAPSKTATRSTGRSSQGSRSRQASASESALAEEPMQTTSQMEEPSHSEFDTCADDQPIVQSSQHPECELAKQADSRSSFNKLMDTPLDFSNFLMNRFKVDTLTPELLAGPTYELMKGSCKSLVKLEYHLEEFFKATTDQLDWVNPEGQQYPHNLLKPLLLIPNNRGRRVIPFEHFINNDLEYFCEGASSRKLTNLTVEERFAFNVSFRMFTRSIVIQRHVEDLQLGVESYQKKLNLTKPDSYRTDLKRKEAYTAYSNPRGFIYQNKDKKNRLMWIDELHKFSDGTLTDVRTTLDDRLK